MAAGLIAGAIGGLGKAVQGNAQSQIEQKRQEALQQLEHGLALEREGVRHQNNLETEGVRHDYGLERDETRHGYNLETEDVRHQNTMTRERYAQGQQNSRHNSQANNDWQLVPVEGGGYAQYSPSRNVFREANLPPGANMGGGELSERDTYRLDGIADQIETIRSRASDEMRALTTEEKAQLGRLQGQYDSLLSAGDSGMTPFERLMAGEEGAESEAGGEPAPDPDSIPGLIAREREGQRNSQEANEAKRAATQARDRADDLLSRIEREMAGGASPGGLMAEVNQARGQGSVSEETLAEAQQVADELLALDQNTHLSADQKRWVAERLMRFQDAGVPLNLEQ